MNNLDVRICEKYSLTVPEAAAYFGIGEKTLRGMISKYKNLGLFLEIGTKHMIKREMFAKFLDKQIEI
ncbi:MAG: helix-turn-helix domain-containing protein [Clostridia bacterium]|nr:helix-turn-helix domain-containing protein [Clostridia bacterium]MBR6533260.1 helix-turn-helix domain-containing protein [Clostridia bacterium]